MNFANENTCLTDAQLDSIQERVEKGLQKVLADLQRAMTI